MTHICTFAIIQAVKTYEVGLMPMKLLIRPWVNKANNKDSTSIDWYLLNWDSDKENYSGSIS